MEYEEIRRKYVDMLNQELGSSQPQLVTKQYEVFRKQYLPKKLTLYEKLCNFSEKILPVSPDKKKMKAMLDAIETAHLQITPRGATSFSLLMPIFLIIVSLFAFLIVPSFFGAAPKMFFVFFFVVTALIMIFPLGSLPLTIASSWRMKASNQMVLSIFYMVTYMRHTSNLELAIDFAADHLGPPLALDLKKVLWDVETEKYENIRESLDNYLQTWRSYNDEYIEAIRLIESSLLESSESRRLDMLDKSLNVMLDETYEKMLHYAHDLQSPITTLHMMGVILPILGLVILPLVVTMIEGIHWYHIFMMYNVALPIAVYLLGRSMLAKRPTGYGNVDITDLNPKLKKYQGMVIGSGKSMFTISPLLLGFFVFSVLFIIGSVPLLFGLFNQGTDVMWTVDNTIETVSLDDDLALRDAVFYFYGWWEVRERQGGDLVATGEYYGPFGLGATLFSLLIPLAFGLGIGMYYRSRSRNVLKIREETKRLEQEFASGLFQLGNRLADGLPAEIAFSKVAAVMRGSETGRFFEITSTNIANGLNVEQAIFDQKKGALQLYPSNIIESSMKVLIESAKKGPLIASQAVINVSNYIKQMHRVDERLKDLMADVISSMKSQVSFLTPVISGIVIGITSMITKILGTLTSTINQFDTGDQQVAGSGVLEIFGSGGVPTFYFQVIVGLYVVQLAYILTVLVNGIENGVDPLTEQELLGKNLWRSTALYVMIAFVIILIFNMVAGQILQNSF